METSISTQGALSIKTLLDDLDSKKILLPEFQRNFTWSIEQTIDLFDSISRNIFIGALILSKPKFDLTCRQIDTRPRKGKGKNMSLLHTNLSQKDFYDKSINVLLDGQQRVTSIYRVLKGYDEIYFVFKRPFDLPTNSNPNLEDLIEGFSVKPNPDLFSISVKQIFEADLKRMKDNQVRETVFNSAIQNYPELNQNDQIREKYFDLTIDLKSLFGIITNDKTFLSVFLLDMDIDKFCMFFERSNSKGINLNFIDIITAKIYKGFNLREKKEEFTQKYNDNSVEDNQILEAFVRYIAYLKDGRVDKKTILEKLSSDDFRDNWDEVSQLYIKAKKILISQKLLFRIDWLPYKTMFIPIMHFIRNLPHKDFSQATAAQEEFFRFWFWSSLLNTRYGGGMLGSTNDIIVEDCNHLEKIAKNQPISRDYLKKFRLDFNDFELKELTSNKGAMVTGLFSLMNYKNPFKELANNSNVNFEEEINIHHIFPRRFVEENFDKNTDERDLVDSFLNKMIIGKISNIKYGKKAPSEYLNQPPLSNNVKLKATLESHYIHEPEKLINGSYDKKMLAFLDERYLKIKDLIDLEIEGVRQKLLKNLKE